jgi:UDP-N-acetylmuramate--alanine ligase
VGIGGAGMRSLAEVLLGWGWQVSGSDLAPESVQFSSQAGVRLYRGHAAAHLARQTDLVIHSDAVPADNPELVRAGEMHVPVQSYFQTLGQMMHDRQGIAVAGTHGKSTTTAMLASLLIEAGHDPTVVFGAAPLGKPNGGQAGRGPLLVVEACEYRANFLHLAPQHAAILGIEPDHFDCYPSPDQLHEAFARFARRVPRGGLLLVRHDCQASRQAAAQAECRTQTFGFQAAADWAALDLDSHTAGVAARANGYSSISPADHAGSDLDSQRGRYAFDLVHRGRKLARVHLRVPGRHNVANALAAAALAWENGVTLEAMVRGLESFAGLRRRLEWLGCWGGVTLLDDYAHHPTEVSATLRAVREMYPGRRIWCVFQPHQASRTARLLDELAASLENADRVFVAEIYRAREPSPRPGEVTAADLAQRIRLPGSDAAGVHDIDLIFRLLATRLAPGDVLITMGAGDIGKLSNAFLDRFRQDRAAG